MSTIDNGTPAAPESTAGTASDGQAEVTAQGFTQLTPNAIGDSYATEAAVLKWTGTDSIATLVHATFTLTNSSGAIVDSDQEIIPMMFPDQVAAVSHMAQVSGAAKLQVQASVGQTYPYSGTLPVFTTSGVTTTPTEYGGQKTTGTVTSTGSKEYQDADVVAVYLNSAGKVVGGDSGVIDFIPAAGSTSFSVTGEAPIPTIASASTYVDVSDAGLIGG